MEKTLAISSIIFSICILSIGLYIYFIGRNKKWIPVNADILRIQVIKKIAKLKSIPSVSIKFSFKVGSINYHPVFDDNLLELGKNDIRKDLMKNKKLLIYYDVKNPNISYIKKPNDGITFIFFGLILLVIGILYLNSIINCKTKKLI